MNNYSEFNELKTTLKKYINNCVWSILPLSINPCSPGQGALAIETRIQDKIRRIRLIKPEFIGNFVDEFEEKVDEVL